MYLKFAEGVDILVHIVCAKFENERGKYNRYTGCNFFFISQNYFSSMYFIVATSTMQPFVAMDTGNNSLVQ